jgi:hypothetical protein
MAVSKNSKRKQANRNQKTAGVSKPPVKNEPNNAFALAAATKGSKRKFPVLGQVSNYAQAVVAGRAGMGAKVFRESNSVNRRTDLLIEYRKFGRSNSFVDRRFGGEAAVVGFCSSKFSPYQWMT